MLGVLTGGYEVLGDMSKVSNGLITIFSRLQAIQLDGEEEIETTAKLEADFAKATNGAVHIVDQQNGQLRSAFDILDDLAGAWGTLDKNVQSALATEAAGIRQRNTLLSIIQNWDSVKESIKSANNSLGSSEQENAAYLDSIEGHIAALDSSFEKLSYNVVSSDLIKFFTDFAKVGTDSLDFMVEHVGVLGTALTGLGLYATIKNFGRGLNAVSIKLPNTIFSYQI